MASTKRAATLERIRKRLHHSRERARRIEHLLAESTTLLMAPDLVATERATVVVELKQLSEERIHLARSIDQLEHDYAAAELDYEDFRRHIGFPRRPEGKPPSAWARPPGLGYTLRRRPCGRTFKPERTATRMTACDEPLLTSPSFLPFRQVQTSPAFATNSFPSLVTVSSPSVQ